MNHLSVKHTNKGFTLVELIITMTLAVMAVMMMAPGLGNWFADNRLSAQSSQLIAALRLAHSEAVKRGQTVTLCASTNVTGANPNCSNVSNWEAGWLIFNDPNTNGAIDTGEQLLATGSALTGSTTLRSSSAGAIRFNSDGTSLTVSWRLCDGRGPGKARQIQLMASGDAHVSAIPDGMTCP